MISQKLICLLAQQVHEVNTVFSTQILGEDKKEWALLTNEQRAALVKVVRKTIAEKIEDPEKAHENWLKEMVGEGWSFGPEFDETKKTHPNMVTYDQLEKGQQTKDYLYLAILKPFYNM